MLSHPSPPVSLHDELVDSPSPSQGPSEHSKFAQRGFGWVGMGWGGVMSGEKALY